MESTNVYISCKKARLSDIKEWIYYQKLPRVGKLVNAATKDCLLAKLYWTKVKAVLVPVPPIFDIYLYHNPDAYPLKSELIRPVCKLFLLWIKEYKDG